MIFLKLDDIVSNKASEKAWIFKGNEIKFTSSVSIIEEELVSIRDKRIIVEIITPHYKSTPSIILSIGKNYVELDKPVNWTGLENSSFYIQYKVPGAPFCYCRTSFLREEGSSIYASFPSILAILERRQFFRVEVPSGSMVIVPKKLPKALLGIKKNKVPIKYAGFIEDISLGGFRCRIDPRRFPNPPLLRAQLGNHRLLLKLTSEKVWSEMDISNGEVVRIKEISLDNRRWWELGIKFLSKSAEQKKLYEYIRLREIELSKAFG